MERDLKVRPTWIDEVTRLAALTGVTAEPSTHGLEATRPVVEIRLTNSSQVRPPRL